MTAKRLSRPSSKGSTRALELPALAGAQWQAAQLRQQAAAQQRELLEHQQEIWRMRENLSKPNLGIEGGEVARIVGEEKQKSRADVTDAAAYLAQGRAQLQAEADRLLAQESQLPEKLVRRLRGLLEDERMRAKLGIRVDEEPMTARFYEKQSKS